MEPKNQSDPSELLDAFEDVHAGEEEFETRVRPQIPRGTAELQIDNVFLNRSRYKGRLQLVAHCIVLKHEQGTAEGMTYLKTWGLEDRENLSWLNADLVALDLNPVHLATRKEDLKRVLKELVGICFHCNFALNKDPQFPPTCYLPERDARIRTISGTESKAPF